MITESAIVTNNPEHYARKKQGNKAKLHKTRKN